MDWSKIPSRGGLSEEGDIVSTALPTSPILPDNTLTQASDGIAADVWKDLSMSFKKAGGFESSLGLASLVTRPDVVQGYNPLTDTQLTSSFTPQFILDNLSEFSTVGSPQQMSQKIAAVQKQSAFAEEYSKRDMWDQAAVIGFAGGVMMDWSSVVPASTLAKVGKTAYVLENAASFAGSQAMRDVLSDSVLTDDEKLTNIGIAGLVGIGFSAGAVGKQWIQTAKAQELQTDLVQSELRQQKMADENLKYIRQDQDGNVLTHETLDEWIAGGKQDISIAEAQGGTINKAIFGFYKDKVYGKITPKGRLYSNVLPSARWAADTLTGTSMAKTRNAGIGIQHSIQSETINQSRKVQDAADAIYAKMVKENPTISMSVKEFKDNFYADVRYQTWDPTLPQTKYYRELAPHYKRSMNRLWEQGKFSGRISKDAKLDAAEIYKPNAYNYDNILKNKSLFDLQLVEASKSGIQKRLSFLNSSLNNLPSTYSENIVKAFNLLKKPLPTDKLPSNARKVAKEYLERLEDMYSLKFNDTSISYIQEKNSLQSLLETPAALKSVLEKYTNETILGVPTVYKPIKDTATAEAKSFKFREFYIDDSYLKEFMDNDFDRALQNTIRTQTVDATVAAHFGDSNLSKWVDEVIKERDEAIKANPEKAALLTEQAEEAIRDVSAGINRMRGYNWDGSLNNSTLEKVLGWLRAATVVGLMGKSALSNIPEIGQVASKWHNVSKETAEAFATAYKNSGVKLSTKEAKRLGYASTFLQDTRQNLLDDSPNALSKSQDASQSITNAAYFAFGQTPVTNTLEKYTAENLIDFIVKVANAGDKATAEELAEITRLGFKKSDLKGIIEQFNTYKVDADGVTVSGIDDWTGNIGIKARAVIENAVRETIIMPDALTKPLWFDKGIGRLFGQFKGFMMAAIEKYALTDLQKGGAHFTKMLLMRTIGGIMSYMARELVAKPVEDIDLSPKRLFQEGLMRGGGIVGHDFLFDVLDQINLGPSRLLGTGRAMQRKSAYGHDPVLRTVAGAPAAVIGDITKTAINISNGNFDLEAYKHLVKYPAGHIALQAIINRVYE